MDRGGVRKGPFEGDPALMFFISLVHFFSRNMIFLLCFFFYLYFIAGISIRVLTTDVSFVVGAPWRCGVLTTYGGIGGVGLGHFHGREHDSTPQSGGGSSSPVKTKPLQIVLLLLLMLVLVLVFGTLHDVCGVCTPHPATQSCLEQVHLADTSAFSLHQLEHRYRINNLLHTRGRD